MKKTEGFQVACNTSIGNELREKAAEYGVNISAVLRTALQAEIQQIESKAND